MSCIYIIVLHTQIPCNIKSIKLMTDAISNAYINFWPAWHWMQFKAIKALEIINIKLPLTKNNQGRKMTDKQKSKGLFTLFRVANSRP